MHYRFVLPVYGFSRGADTRLKTKRFQGFSAEIKKAGSFKLNCEILGRKLPISVSLVDKKRFLQNYKSNKWLVNLMPKSCLVIDSDIEVRDSASITFNGEIRKVILMKTTTENEFRFLVQTVLLAVNLAYTGSISIEDYNETRFYADGKPLEKNEPNFDGGFFEQISTFSKGSTWPNLKDLKFADVWAWFNKNAEIFDGFSKTQVSRVINAAKYNAKISSFSQEGFAESIIWSIIAVEALFLKDVGTDKSKTQELKRRIVYLLGKIPQELPLDDKDLSEFYNFRSRFLHGDVDFPAPDFPVHFSMVSDDKSYSKFFWKSRDVAVIFGAIMVSTLKLMIKKGWLELNFDYDYKIDTKKN